MNRLVRLSLTLALAACLAGAACDRRDVTLVTDVMLASCTESTVFLAGWWSAVGTSPSMDPIGGYVMLYWIDEDGNACHGTPGTSGRPGPFALRAFHADAWSAARNGLPVTAAQLEDFQQATFGVEPYAGSGLHFVQHTNVLWRRRDNGTAFRSGYRFSVPAVVSPDRGSFCVSAVATTRPECASTQALPLPHPPAASGQHPTKCGVRSKPTGISPPFEERLDACLLLLPHGLEVTEP